MGWSQQLISTVEKVPGSAYCDSSKKSRGHLNALIKVVGDARAPGRAAGKIYPLLHTCRTLDVGTIPLFAFGYLMLPEKAEKMQAHVGNRAGEITKKLLS
jgi:hypothetical protein